LAQEDVFAVRMAAEEAIANAHKHAHRGDWGIPIEVRYLVAGGGVALRVDDRGPGFDPQRVPDPLAEENLDRSHGRGLLLMHAYMSRVCHNEKGNSICLCRHHPRGGK
jgi:serine/threonine-protein kinase RsbW